MENETSTAAVALTVKPPFTKEIVIGFVAGAIVVGGALAVNKWRKAKKVESMLSDAAAE